MKLPVRVAWYRGEGIECGDRYFHKHLYFKALFQFTPRWGIALLHHVSTSDKTTGETNCKDAGIS